MIDPEVLQWIAIIILALGLVFVMAFPPDGDS